MNPAKLIAEESLWWDRLLAALDGVLPDRFEEPTITPAGWSLKDLMFHIGAWCADAQVQLERMKAGTFEPRIDTSSDIERQNEEWFELSRALDVKTCEAELASARTMMLAAWGELEQITPDAWEWFEESGPLHYAKHIKDIKEWLGEGS
jgi:Mycothiol maleylpyruvate isomerase N-terminal domain